MSYNPHTHGFYFSGEYIEFGLGPNQAATHFSWTPPMNYEVASIGYMGDDPNSLLPFGDVEVLAMYSIPAAAKVVLANKSSSSRVARFHVTLHPKTI